jgi:capsular polysaccharide biosynthesis protein
LNESELRDPLKRLGFSFYFMEDLSFKEQIALFATSEIILSPHGAALSFGIFSAPDSVMIEINSKARFDSSKYFYDLCVKCSLHWFLFSAVESVGENYRVDINSLRGTLMHIISIR